MERWKAPILMQCDVYRNANDESGEIPFLLDVQADLLSELLTRVVVPLVRSNAFGRRATRLHPQFAIGEEDVVMATHLIAAVRRQTLGNSVDSLRSQRDVVISAIDVLWSGV
jgi:toxin CcdB